MATVATKRSAHICRVAIMNTPVNEITILDESHQGQEYNRINYCDSNHFVFYGVKVERVCYEITAANDCNYNHIINDHANECANDRANRRADEGANEYYNECDEDGEGDNENNDIMNYDNSELKNSADNVIE